MYTILFVDVVIVTPCVRAGDKGGGKGGTSAGRLQLLQGGREISFFAFPIPLLDNAVGLSLGALFVSRADSAKAREFCV